MYTIKIATPIDFDMMLFSFFMLVGSHPEGLSSMKRKETGPDGSGRNPTESDVNRKQGHICKYVPMRLLMLYL